MMIKAGNLPLNINLRLGLKDSDGTTSALTGLGYDWWENKTGRINTALGISVDYIKSPDIEDTSLSINIKWGF